MIPTNLIRSNSKLIYTIAKLCGFSFKYNYLQSIIIELRMCDGVYSLHENEHIISKIEKLINIQR